MKQLYISLVTIFFATILTAQDTRVWGSYYGSTGNENAIAIATDPFGNVFFAGVTNSNGMAYNGHQMTFGGGNIDAYLVKFNSSGQRVWATYYGGSGDEMPFFGGKLGIATDANGSVFLAGLTSSTNAIASGGFQNTNGGGYDAYLVKFDSAGVRQWGTYYGGSGVDHGYACATDAQGNVYLCGDAASAGLATSNAYQTTISGSVDAYLVKFDGSGARLWATYFGGPGTEDGMAVATDPVNSDVVLVGTTSSTSGIANQASQGVYGGGASDAFLAKFSQSGTAVWATYFGGNGDENVLFNSDVDVAFDSLHNCYMVGLTTSTAGVGTINAMQVNYGGGSYDGFIAEYTQLGAMYFGSYIGGSGDDRLYGVVCDSLNNAYVCGRTTSASGIASNGFQNTYQTNEDGFISRIGGGISPSFECATYYGGNDLDWTDGVVLGPAGTLYGCGSTASTSGISQGGFQNSFGGGQSDAYVIRMTRCSISLDVQPDQPVNAVSVFPNPTDGKFTLETGVSNSQVEIRNAIGELVYGTTFDSQTTVDVTHLAKGMYSCRILTSDKSYSQILILE